MLGHLREHGGQEVRPGERFYREQPRVEQEALGQRPSHRGPHGARGRVLRRLQLQRLDLHLELRELAQVEVGRGVLHAARAQRQGNWSLGAACCESAAGFPWNTR